MRDLLRIGVIAAVATMATTASLFAQTPPDTTKTQEPPQVPMANYDEPKSYIVNKIKVTGVRFLDAEVLSTSTGINKGDTIVIPSDYLSSALRRMWEQRYFSDIRIVAQPEGDSVNLEIFMQERPRVYKWLYEGASRGEKTDIIDQLKLKPGRELSDYIINTSTNTIKKFYRGKGFLNAEVNVKQENDTSGKNAVNVTFAIKRGPRVKIGAIDFEGNETFSDRKLRKTFKKTHKKSINFFRGAKLKDTEYAEDKELLIDFYNSRGYRNADIVMDSIYPINDKRIGIHLKINEGNKFYIRNVSWVGNSIYKTEALNNILGLRKGDTYDRKAIHKRLGIGREVDMEDPTSVSSLYQNAGYMMSSVEPGEVIVGEDSIDLTIRIFEGKQARINDVGISGNMRVNENVIRRDLYIRPGELYDRSLLMQTMRQLAQMQHFDAEKLQPGISPVTNELVDVAFPLEEQASDKFEVSGGWGDNTFVGSVGVQFNNFSIKNLFKKNAWRPYPSGQNQQLALRGQTNGTYYKALSMSFTEPWLGGKKPHSMTFSAYYSDETNAYSVFQGGTKHFRTIGVSLGFGRRLGWPDRMFTLYNEIGYQAYNLQDWDNFIVKNGTSNIISLKTVFGRNSVDDPIYPRRGSDFSIALTLTPPYSLFDGKNYADPNMSENDRYRLIEFHKWMLNGQWFFPLSPDNKFVLMARAQMGFIGSYNKNKPSPFEGFDVGGDGMSGYNVYGVDLIGMRGYKNNSLTPYSPTSGSYARAYNKYTIEVRYPIIMQPSSKIFGLVFVEGGNAFSSLKEFDPFLIKRAAGVGVRLYLPIVGMLGFDWGYGFDRAVGENKPHGSQIHFMIGQQF